MTQGLIPLDADTLTALLSAGPAELMPKGLPSSASRFLVCVHLACAYHSSRVAFLRCRVLSRLWNTLSLRLYLFGMDEALHLREFRPVYGICKKGGKSAVNCSTRKTPHQISCSTP